MTEPKADIFKLEGETVIETPEPAEVPTEQPEQELPQGDTPKDVLNDAAKHFQSLADKRLAELERLRIENEKLQQEIAPKAVTPDPLTPPVKPQKPAGYNRVDALTDPESPSFKYEEAMSDYRDQMNDYSMRLLEEKTKPFEEDRKRKLEEAEYLQRKSQALSQFQAVGLDAVESEKAFKFFSSEDSLKPENLVKMWKAYVKSLDAPNQQKVNNMNQRQSMKEPLPVGVAGGQSQVLDDGDSFNQALKAKGSNNLFAFK